MTVRDAVQAVLAESGVIQSTTCKVVTQPAESRAGALVKAPSRSICKQRPKHSDRQKAQVHTEKKREKGKGEGCVPHEAEAKGTRQCPRPGPTMGKHDTRQKKLFRRPQSAMEGILMCLEKLRKSDKDTLSTSEKF
jgi:hypothetical protein